MINIKTPREIELMRVAGEIVGDTHKYLSSYLKPGITTKQIDSLARDYIIKRGATPSCYHYDGYPGNICISINDEVVHGIASERKLCDGDIVTLDICACFKGYHGDSAWTYPVGNISEEKKYLLEHTEKSLYEGLKQVKAGAHVGDIGEAVQKYAESHNLSVVRELVGHGVGNNLHEDPDVPNYGKKNTGPILKEGMVIAVEPMINLGSREVYIEDDDWTVVTLDHKPSAHFEHTVLITKDGYEILTKR